MKPAKKVGLLLRRRSAHKRPVAVLTPLPRRKADPIGFDLQKARMHTIVASMRFPGPDYYQVLAWLHEILRPERYVEIGVFRGDSLKLVKCPTVALGIDPFPAIDDSARIQARVIAMPSDEFFRRHSLREFFGINSFSFAFVDGLHQFEQVISDIFNLEAYALPDSVIAVHDTLPLDESTSSRERRTLFHTGDVWKLIPFLQQYRPDLETVTITAGPSGLTLIRGLDPAHAKSKTEAEGISHFRQLTWDYYRRRRHEFLKTVPNERSAVAAWLAGEAR